MRVALCCSFVWVQENTFWEDGHESAWAKTHRKGEFTGLKIPFGARVLFKPSGTRLDDKLTRWAPDSLEGVFAGYLIQPGYTWSREYLLWPIIDFDGLKLLSATRRLTSPLRSPTRLEELSFRQGSGASH